ncbi:MAG: hypothetical protein R6V04_03165 [bacterium]
MFKTLSILVTYCNKTSTNSKSTRQLTVPTSIAENTTWTSDTDYIIEGLVTVEKGASLNIGGKVFKADEQGDVGRLANGDIYI